MIDASLYPEFDEAPNPTTLEERADYVHRVCTSWDFGVTPGDDALDGLRAWKDAFDFIPLLRSPAYHAFRRLYGWEAMEHEEPLIEERWERMDALAGRPPDTSVV